MNEDVILQDMRSEECVAEFEDQHIELDARTIAEARKALALTQTQVANVMEITQSALSQMEKREDMMVSTIQSYIKAIGGKLELVAKFPGMSPIELSLGSESKSLMR